MSGSNISVGRRAALAMIAATATLASARGRESLGGRAQLRIPWPTTALDPHRLDDVACAIFGAGVFDSLYQFDGRRITAVLAEELPELRSDGTRVRLRSGITTAAGHALGARDVIASIARTRSGDGRAWLADVPVPRRVDDVTLHFAHGPLDGNTPVLGQSKLALCLASPLCAIVPASFTPDRPDATGAFAASRDAGTLVLSRNVRAAMGASFLEGVVCRPAVDLADSLRAFEAGTDDIGWLGLGLHDPRAGARAFDAGPVAYALLRTGHDAGVWDTPGVAQRLADGIAPSLLGNLAPGPPWTVQPDQGWGGSPCEMLVRDDAPYLVELARAVAAALSKPSHEITVRQVPSATMRDRRASRAYALAIDVVRPFAPGLVGVLAALATSDNPDGASDAVRHPPHITDVSPRTLTRTMHIGVVSEVHIQGGRIPELTLPTGPSGGIDWGNATRGHR